MQRLSSTTAAAAVLLFAFALRTIGLDAQSLWYDEAFTALFARNDVGQIISDIARLDLNTPLHYLVLKFWGAMGGQSEFALRYLSVTAGVTTAAVAYRLARRNMLGALLVAVAPVLVLASQELRMYALAVAFSTASVWLALRATRVNTPQAWAAWAVIGLAGFLSHVLAALVLGVTALALLPWFWRTRSRPALLAACATFGPIVLFAGVMLGLRADYGVAFTGRPPLSNLVLEGLSALLLPRNLPANAITTVAALSALLLLAAMWRMPQLGGITLITLVAVIVFCWLSGKFAPRYLVFVTPLLLPALCAGRVSPITRPTMLMLAVLGLISLFALRPAWANDDWRGLVRMLRENRHPDEAVVLVAGHAEPSLRYYWPDGEWVALPPDAFLDVRNALDYDSAVPALNAALSGKRGAWLIEWQHEVSDPSSLARTLLARQSVGFTPGIDSRNFAGLGLKRYAFFAPHAALPADVAALNLSSELLPAGRDAGLNGLGCNTLRDAQPGTFFEALCLWQINPDAPPPYDTQVSLRLIDRVGATRVQSDGQLAREGLPVLRFDKPVLTVHHIQLPEDLPPGDYMFVAVPYVRDVGEITPQVRTPVRIAPPE
jgi:mannosyltransferase